MNSHLPNWQHHFKNLAQYNIWATQRLFHHLQTVSDADYYCDAGLFFKSIHGTLNHLLIGEHYLWYRRFSENISPKVVLNAEVESNRERLAHELEQGANRWLTLIDSWDHARFEGIIKYTTMRGEIAELPFAMTLAHVFNHGTHHRGQITAALTRMDYLCPELDMVYFLQGQKAK